MEKQLPTVTRGSRMEIVVDFANFGSTFLYAQFTAGFNTWDLNFEMSKDY